MKIQSTRLKRSEAGRRGHSDSQHKVNVLLFFTVTGQRADLITRIYSEWVDEKALTTLLQSVVRCREKEKHSWRDLVTRPTPMRFSGGYYITDRLLSALLCFPRAAMPLVRAAAARLRRAAEEEEREPPPPPPPPSHHSNHQFASMKNKFFNELTHLPSERTHRHTHV